MRAGLQDARELAEAQDHAALLFRDEHEAVHHQPQDEDDADPAGDAAGAAITARKAAECVLQALEDGAVGAPLRIAAVAGPAGNVPGHRCSRESARF